MKISNANKRNDLDAFVGKDNPKRIQGYIVANAVQDAAGNWVPGTEVGFEMTNKEGQPILNAQGEGYRNVDVRIRSDIKMTDGTPFTEADLGNPELILAAAPSRPSLSYTPGTKNRSQGYKESVVEKMIEAGRDGAFIHFPEQAGKTPIAVYPISFNVVKSDNNMLPPRTPEEAALQAQYKELLAQGENRDKNEWLKVASQVEGFEAYHISTDSIGPGVAMDEKSFNLGTQVNDAKVNFNRALREASNFDRRNEDKQGSTTAQYSTPVVEDEIEDDGVELND